MSFYFRVSSLHLALYLFAWIGASSIAGATNVEWTRRVVSDVEDFGAGVATDRLGNVYFVGSTAGNSAEPSDTYDGFLYKYDALGNLQWTRKLATEGWDHATSVTVDEEGSIYVGGDTSGVIGEKNIAAVDSFVSKFDEGGGLIWTCQFGNSASVNNSQALRSIASDGLGNLYVTGHTAADARWSNNDAYVTKLDSEGNLLWTRQFGTNRHDYGIAIAADNLGNVFVTGTTFGDLGGPHTGGTIISDAFVSKFDGEGNLRWSRQLAGAYNDYGFAAAVDGTGNVYVAGATNSELGETYDGGFHDPFVAKYNTDGDRVWIRQDGTAGSDEAYGIALDGEGGLYISGNIEGTVDLIPSSKGSTFVTKYDLDGNLAWTRNINEGSGDAIAIGPLGVIFVAGEIDKLVEPPSMDWSDAFLSRVGYVPEPNSLVITTIGIAIGSVFRRTR